MKEKSIFSRNAKKIFKIFILITGILKILLINKYLLKFLTHSLTLISTLLILTQILMPHI
jgi:hypothetical protein